MKTNVKEMLMVFLLGLGMSIVAIGQQPPKADQPQPAQSSDQQQAGANQSQQMQGMSPESEVLSKMRMANQVEIKAGELAKSKASDPHIRNYGDLLVKDHKVADRMIQNLAARQGIALAEPMPKTDQEKSQMEMQKQAMAELESLSGPEFDQKFIAFNKQAHDMAVQMTTMASSQLKPGPVQMLVSRMVPILKQHDALADHLGQRQTASKQEGTWHTRMRIAVEEAYGLAAL